MAAFLQYISERQTKAKLWTARIGAVILLATLALAQLPSLPGLSDVTEFAIGLAIFLLLLAIEMVMDVAKGVKRLESVHERRQYTLEECTREMRSLVVRHQSNRPKIVLDHLGLDMHEALRKVRPLLTEANPSEVMYRALIVTDLRVAGWPRQMERWSDNVRTSLGNGSLVEDLKKLERALESSETRFHLEVRKYNSLPVLHGFELKEPLKLWYFSVCRWSGRTHNDFDSGDDRYLRFDQGDLANPIDLDFTKIFRSYFDHLWEAPDTVSIYERSNLVNQSPALQR